MVLAELSLAIAAVKGVGEAIDAAKSVAEVAGQLDNALNLTEKAKKKTPAKPTGKHERIVQQKLDKYDNTDGESTELGAIVQEVTDGKALRDELYRLGIRLDNKWGKGTWDKILEIREKRLAKQKQLEQDHRDKLKELQEERKKFWLEMLKVIGLLATLTVFAIWLLQYY
tara:strand:+ start:56 stop:565 length:510 start_codon:yes stop_codon:yes gene_type:complete